MPILVKALQYDDKGVHHNNSYWQLVKKHYEGDDECIGADCSNCDTKNSCNYIWFAMMNNAAKYLRKNNRWRLFSNIPKTALEAKDVKEYFKEWFHSDNGMTMLKELLGPIDLLVIDEAHKSRGNNSRLETIITKIIDLKSNSKRIAMTATPMELQPEQWEKLFERIGESDKYPEDEIKKFANSRQEVIKYPNNRKKVKTLISLSNCFTNALKPFVTRRRRIKDKEMIDLMGLNKTQEYATHPHRKPESIEIQFSNINNSWKPSIFALEAIGKAAKGIKTEDKEDKELKSLLRKLKVADSRYAAGQIDESNIDDDDDDKIDKAIKQYITKCSDVKTGFYLKSNCGKLRRVQYWRKILKKSENALSGHPRVQIVADEIERIVWGNNGTLTGEKVLIFGTFKKPLRALWDVLNRRSVLRFFDRKITKKEPPIPAVKACLTNLDSIWNEYNRLTLKTDIAIKRVFSKKEDLKQAITKGGKTYKSIRNRFTFDDDFVKSLPGAATIEKIKSDVKKLLRNRLANDLICQGVTEESQNSDEIKTRALNIWVEYLEAYFDVESEEDKKLQAKTEWNKPAYFNGNENQIDRFKQLNRFAENIDEKNLKELVCNETKNISERLSFFARLLDGDVKMETRRMLQTQFNDQKFFPRVLIAQSQVGREGLNLHKACRTIIQFHSEWNPGVVEQQIGRVDRIESYWQKLAEKFKKEKKDKSISDEEFPKIIIKPVVFEGTYDAFQCKVSKKRQETMNAHLFGELIDAKTLEKIPKGCDWKEIQEALKKSAPDFSPPDACTG
ncbi:helicase-related protein [Desulfosarcina sp. BuS5]|uniref:helicase-related protein n=1 Tax=Desulfosarcina sp. BuS5 TaxID=933262 RepID=UPI001E459F56|nr:helicase-related protein [Desulfosarcina sp. BuS5]